jgi:hypothetical protein
VRLQEKLRPSEVSRKSAEVAQPGRALDSILPYLRAKLKTEPSPVQTRPSAHLSSALSLFWPDRRMLSVIFAFVRNSSQRNYRSYSSFFSSFRTSSFVFSVNSIVTNVPFQESKNLLSEISSIIDFIFFSNISG